MIKKPILKIVVIILAIGLNWVGVLSVEETAAYYFDNEDSKTNLFEATLLDFNVTNSIQNGDIGMEALSEKEFASVVIKTTGSLDVQYELYADKISGSDQFCNSLLLTAEQNGIEKHNGSLMALNVPATPLMGTWEFEIDLPVSADEVPQGVECNVDFVFRGWRQDVVDFANSGFTDEERINLNLTSRMIVLNEFLPNPDDGQETEWDFGTDDSVRPYGEWIEVYNNSIYSLDVGGWYIKDGQGNKIDITNSRTQEGDNTIIGPKGWLVVYMNGAILDNDGDIIELYNTADHLIDSYSYSGGDYCELEPTPGDENSGSISGTCSSVEPNKSFARIPDGIGAWVDPFPTPGRGNKLELVQQVVEGAVSSAGSAGGSTTSTEDLIIPSENLNKSLNLGIGTVSGNTTSTPDTNFDGSGVSSQQATSTDDVIVEQQGGQTDSKNDTQGSSGDTSGSEEEGGKIGPGDKKDSTTGTEDDLDGEQGSDGLNSNGSGSDSSGSGDSSSASGDSNSTNLIYGGQTKE